LLTDELDTMASVFQRLTQRKIAQWAIAYVAGAWLLIEVLGFVAENFGWPAGIVRGAAVFLGIGFFVALVLAWYHGEKGQQRATGLELLIIAGLLLVAGATAAYVSQGSAPEESETGVPPTLAIDPRSIAILPFANRSAEGENAAFFAEGMHDDILTTLAQIGSLTVISRTSTLKYRETEKSIPEIARELSVATVLEGSVQRAEDRVRVNVQLIDASTDRQLWAQTYDEELTTANIFTIQSSIARKIAAALQAKLAPEVEARLDARPTESLEAYDLYTRGRYLSNRSLTREDQESAADYYRQAIAADPTYAPAYVGLASTYLVLWRRGLRPPEETLPLGRAAVERALELDETLAEAHAALGTVLTAELRFGEAEREFQRALELNHGSAEVHRQYGRLLSRVGRHEESVREARLALHLDPLSVRLRVSLVSRLFFARDFDGAIDEALKVLELEPDHVNALSFLGGAYTLNGQREEGIAALQRAIELDPDNLFRVTQLAWAYARSERREQALETLQEIDVEPGPILKEIAIVYGELGDLNRAFEYLDRAYAEDPGNLAYMRADPTADSLKNDPRFAELMRKLGLQ
jgi:serine/threonine-protein kinase